MLNQIADSLKPSVRKLFVAAVQKVTNRVDWKELEKVLRSQGTTAALRLIPFEAMEEFGKAEAILHGAIVKAGKVSTKPLAALLRVDAIDFNPNNPFARAWAKKHAAELVVEITDSSRKAIRGLIADQFKAGLDTPTLTRLINKTIGLRDDQIRAITNYRGRLVKAGESPERIEKLVKDYAIAHQRWRAETIARTETINSVNKGLDVLWEEKVREGLLDTEKFRQDWHYTDDELCTSKVCPTIPTMPENQDVRIGGKFTLPDGTKIDGPTAHPDCRCSKTLRRID